MSVSPWRLGARLRRAPAGQDLASRHTRPRPRPSLHTAELGLSFCVTNLGPAESWSSSSSAADPSSMSRTTIGA